MNFFNPALSSSISSWFLCSRSRRSWQQSPHTVTTYTHTRARDDNYHQSPHTPPLTWQSPIEVVATISLSKHPINLLITNTMTAICSIKLLQTVSDSLTCELVACALNPDYVMVTGQSSVNLAHLSGLLQGVTASNDLSSLIKLKASHRQGKTNTSQVPSHSSPSQFTWQRFWSFPLHNIHWILCPLTLP